LRDHWNGLGTLKVQRACSPLMSLIWSPTLAMIV
jgi:hypothetical protein